MPLHRTVPTVFVLATAALTGLTGCGAVGGTTTPAGTVAAGVSSAPAQSGLGGDEPGPEATETDATDDGTTGSDGSGSNGSTPKKPHTSRPTHTSEPQGPRIASFKVVQKPKCEEGTAVFRAKAVPLIIEWRITGADSGALSVDDPTNTPGTYSQVGLEGTEEFGFSCAGEVGSTETHTYAIYSVGGGEQKRKTLTVSAKVLDKGIGTN